MHDQLEEGTLARTRSADDEHELALVDAEAYVVESVGAVGIGF